MVCCYGYDFVCGILIQLLQYMPKTNAGGILYLMFGIIMNHLFYINIDRLYDWLTFDIESENYSKSYWIDNLIMRRQYLFVKEKKSRMCGFHWKWFACPEVLRLATLRYFRHKQFDFSNVIKLLIYWSLVFFIAVLSMLRECVSIVDESLGRTFEPCMFTFIFTLVYTLTTCKNFITVICSLQCYVMYDSF